MSSVKMNHEFLKIFVNESEEELDQLDNLTLKLESAPKNTELLSQMMRLFHTIKGNSRMLGLTELSELAHFLEDCIKGLKEGKLEFSDEFSKLIFAGLDELRKGISVVSKGGKPKIELKQLKQKLHQLLKSKPKITPPKLYEQSHTNTELKSIRISTDTMDEMLRYVIELNTKITGLKKKRNVLPTDLDELTNMAKLLQDEILEMRMYPLERVFMRYPRMVKELGLEQGKKVELVLNCGDTLLDRSVLDLVHDPLIHIMRNAVDHGIESPEERKALGKPETGRIELSAEKHKDFVVIRVKDDGRGINDELLLQRAIELGLITKEEALRMRKEDVLRLMYVSGFSTKKQITDVSGRGVGMDIVLNNIKKAGGNVIVKSEEGAGTTIELHLPLTLAIMNAILVRVGEFKLIVPLMVVERVMDYDEYRSGYGIRINNRAIPFYKLGDFLGIEHQPSKVLVINYRNMLLALGIDDIIDRQNLLVNKPDRRTSSLPGVGGASVLENGEVCIVLDLSSLFGEVNRYGIGTTH